MSYNNSTNFIKPNIKVNNWEFLPDIIDDLSKYLEKRDLIELSLVCRNYRAQLRSIVFKTLILFMHPVKIFNWYNHIPGRRNKYNNIIEDMRKFSIDNPFTVKEICFRSRLPQYFIRELLDIFKTIECSTITLSDCPKMPILSKSKHLNQLKLQMFFNNTAGKSADEKFLSLCKKMKTLKIEAFWDYRSRSPPFFQIDSTFTNLTTLNAYNTKIFSLFPIQLHNLVYIEFSIFFRFETKDLSKLVEFFEINPQLKKLSIHMGLLNCEVFKSIFKLNSLKYLRIDNTMGFKITSELNGIENRSIEHLEMTHLYRTEDFKLFSNSCINLKTVQINNLDRYYDTHVELNNNRIIKFLLIMRYSIKDNLATLPLSLISQFSSIHLYNWEQVFKFKKTFNRLNGWKFREDYTDKSTHYCITRV